MVFSETEGDLAAVSLVLIQSEEAWRAPMTKMRNPAEFITAIIRATGILPAKPQPVLGRAEGDGHDSLATAGAERVSRYQRRLGLARGDEGAARHLLARRAAGQDRGAAARRARRGRGNRPRPPRPRAIARAESRQQGLAILFMSPEFQRR